MNRSEAEKAAGYLLNELLSFVEKPPDAMRKVTEWFENESNLDTIKKIEGKDIGKEIK